MSDWWHEIRRTLRTMARRPTPTLVGLSTLTVGIGATAAIWALVQGVLVDPLAYPEPQRIVTVWEDLEAFGGPVDEWTSMVVARTWREAAGDAATLAAWTGWQPTLGGSEPVRLSGLAVSDGWFEVFGVEPVRGRAFREDEEGVLVISDGLWRRLGSDPEIVGSTLRLDSEDREVLGVLPAGFRPPAPVDAISPFPLPADADDLGNAYLRVVARLAPGTSPQVLEERLEAATADLAARHPSRMDPAGVTVIPLQERLVGEARPLLLALLAAAGLLLLVACVNVAAVQLVRADERRRELALRSALGASRGRLALHVLFESMVLALLGGLGGLLLGSWGSDLLVRFAPDGVSLRLAEMADGAGGVDGALILFVAAVALAAGVLSALPALATGGRRDLVAALGAGDARSGVGRSRLRPLLVVVQLGLALALAVGATLLARSFGELLEVDPGFRSDLVVTGDVSLPSSLYEREDRHPFFARLIERLEGRGEIAAAAAMSRVPLDDQGDSDLTVAVVGTPPEEDDSVWYRVVTPGVFDALRLPVVEGRPLAATDAGGDGPRVLVNGAFVHGRLGERDRETARIVLGGRGSERGPSPIVGVVGEIRDRALDESPRVQMYLLHEDFPVGVMTVVIRAAPSATVDAAVRALREEVGALDPGLPVDRIRTMDSRVAASVAVPRFASGLFAGFAAVALFLASVGVYGMLTVWVVGRRREIGIRMALGADVAAIRSQVLFRALGLAAAGLVLGALIAVGVARGLGSMLYGVGATDPWSWLGPVAFLAVAALVAAARPTWTASRTDPAVVLREE